MVTTLIITRAIHIGASILIAGIFTFDFVTLGLTGQPESNDLYEFERRLFRLAFWSLIASLLSALLWFWLEVASMMSCRSRTLSPRQRGGRSCLKRNSVESGSFGSA